MDISLLASGAVSLLAAYLGKAGEALAKKAGEEIFSRLQQHFSKRPALQEAVDDLQKKPDDPDRGAAARVQMAKLLESDPALAATVEQILKKAEESSSGNTKIINMNARDNAIQIGELKGNFDNSGKR